MPGLRSVPRGSPHRARASQRVPGEQRNSSKTSVGRGGGGKSGRLALTPGEIRMVFRRLFRQPAPRMPPPLLHREVCAERLDVRAPEIAARLAHHKGLKPRDQKIDISPTCDMPPSPALERQPAPSGVRRDCGLSGDRDHGSMLSPITPIQVNRQPFAVQSGTL